MQKRQANSLAFYFAIFSNGIFLFFPLRNVHIEQKIIQEAKLVLKSKQFKALCDAFSKGIPYTEIINRRTIQVEPELPFSGMTLFKENGFLLGKEAFVSKEELIKTLLHEIYRLETSTIRKTGKATQQEIIKETKAASEFAESASVLLLEEINARILDFFSN